MWRASISALMISSASAARKNSTAPVVHANYLVNLAAADPVIRARSIGAFRGELERLRHRRRLRVAPGSYRDYIAARRHRRGGARSRSRGQRPWPA
jgi:deoxyribonuclease-4